MTINKINILFIFILLVSPSFSSIFNTPCKKDCQASYIQCYNKYLSNLDSFSFEICANLLDLCIKSCIIPHTFTPKFTLNPQDFNKEIPKPKNLDSNFFNNQQQSQNNIQDYNNNNNKN